MARVLVWDLPTRLFHWAFAGGFIAAAVIALGLGDDSPIFPYHSIIGLTIALLIVLRIFWGLIGSRYARFGSFLFAPSEVLAYTRGVLSRRGPKHTGHNPGSSYAIFAMLAIMTGLAITGIMMARGNESVEELHEILAYSMLAVVGVHIMGVIVHTVQHRENITASMIHGRKNTEGTDAGIRSAHPILAVAMVVLTGAWVTGLVSNYDANSQTTKLPLLGVSLTLGEGEGGESDETDHGPELRPGAREDYDEDDD